MTDFLKLRKHHLISQVINGIFYINSIEDTNKLLEVFSKERPKFCSSKTEKE